MEALWATSVRCSDCCAVRVVVDVRLEKVRGSDAEHRWKAFRIVAIGRKRESTALTGDTNTAARIDY